MTYVFWLFCCKSITVIVITNSGWLILILSTSIKISNNIDL